MRKAREGTMLLLVHRPIRDAIFEEDNRTDNSLEEARGTTNSMQEQEAYMWKNWLEVQKRGFNL